MSYVATKFTHLFLLYDNVDDLVGILLTSNQIFSTHVSHAFMQRMTYEYRLFLCVDI